MPQQYSGTGKEVRQEKPTVCTVRLALDTPIFFEAGQFVLVTGEKEIKPYSIASPPLQKTTIELCVKQTGGEFSRFLCGLEKEEKLLLTGPMGHFVVQDTKNDVAFLASGTGISALRGMVHTLMEKGAGKKVWLFLGVRTEDEIIYRKEFEGLAEKHKNFVFIPVLSRPEKGWVGERGHVQDAVTKYVKAPEQTDIYICGVKAMVEECVRFAEAKGFAKVYYEKYV